VPVPEAEKILRALKPAVLRERYARLKRARDDRHAQILFTKVEASPERTIAVRLGMIVLLLALAVGIFWLDRDGLRDTVDGDLSFSDILYFTMVTVTTVGYGDIVPVSDRARMVDAFLVTPIRIFIWFIFLGTAYQLVFQKLLEDYRMSRLNDQLQDHVVICGYGVTGRVAASELVAKGFSPHRIIVIDEVEHNLREAARAGFVGLRGDAAREEVIRRANIDRAAAVVVSPGRDDTAALIVLTVRNSNPRVKIVSSVNEEENIKLIRQAGAHIVVSPSRVGGYLLADAVSTSHVADYVLDLLTAGGHVRLIERAALPEEIGMSPRQIHDALVVRIHRGEDKIGYWESDKFTIRAGDILLMIAHHGAA